LVWISRWRGAVSGVVCQIWIVGVGHFPPVTRIRLRASNLCEHQTKAVFDLKLMVGGSEHKVVLDQGGFR